ncbi:hypothetical protein RhiirB3_446701 [Rhizophagus irregularis]|nr:hypothetical protein RhiirB3_446701 [Rhizophagus irregularis]
MILLIIRIYFSRHYYADVDKARVEIKRLIKEGEWDTKEFTEMRKILFKALQVEHNPVDNEVILKELKSHEKLLKENNNEVILEKLKSHDEKLDKLEKLENKLENLDKLEKLEKKLEKLEKLLEEKHAK